jgi:hypothetical protein
MDIPPIIEAGLGALVPPMDMPPIIEAGLGALVPPIDMPIILPFKNLSAVTEPGDATRATMQKRTVLMREKIMKLRLREGGER